MERTGVFSVFIDETKTICIREFHKENFPLYKTRPVGVIIVWENIYTKNREKLLVIFQKKEP